MTTPGKVPWVVGRRKALARALAIEVANALQVDWTKFPQQQKDKFIQQSDAVVRQWIGAGVLAEFDYDYREQE